MLPNRPLLVTTGFSVPANAIRDPQNKFDLVNPYKEPVFLDEIRFDYIQDTAGIYSTDDVKVELLIGNTLLTNKPIPIASLNTSFNPHVGSQATRTTNGIVYKLAKPLILNPEDVLTPRIHNGLAVALNMQITYVMRRIAGGIDPSQIWYPYIANWTSSTFTIQSSTAPFVIESTQSDLVNPHDVPLHLDRMIGYTAKLNTSYPNAAAVVLNLKMLDAAGNAFIRDQTPFASVFNMSDWTFKMNALLQPHEFFIVQLSYENDGQYLANALSDYDARITMIGYRPADVNIGKRPDIGHGIRTLPQRLPVLPRIAQKLPNLPNIPGVRRK